MKFANPFLLSIILISCSGPATEATVVTAAVAPSQDAPKAESSVTLDVNHKYSYVKINEDGTKVAGLLDLYGTNDFTHSVNVTGGQTFSGRGNFTVNGDKIIFHKTAGTAVDGVLTISKGSDNKIWLTLSNGVTYVEDDKSVYLKSMTVTPHKQNSIEQEDEQTDKNGDIVGDYSNIITYKGTVNDSESGFSQDYTLYIKSDFSAASIGGGPYYKIEDQNDGTYLWLDGTIVGMSFRPMKNKSIIYGSDGGLFCTLYKK
jgi:hypothetical protein